MALTWQDWPAQRQRGRALLVGVVIVIASVSVAILDPLLAAIGSVAMLAAVSEVLLPSTYALSDEGVVVKNVLRVRRHPWRHFRGLRVVPDGIVLLGEGPAGIIRRRRTLLLRCPENADAVTAALEQWLPGEE